MASHAARPTCPFPAGVEGETMSTMTTQTAGRVAWALAGLAVILVGLGLVLAAANGTPPSLVDESLTQVEREMNIGS